MKKFAIQQCVTRADLGYAYAADRKQARALALAALLDHAGPASPLRRWPFRLFELSSEIPPNQRPVAVIY